MRKIVLKMDGNQIVALWDDFDCLAVSPAGFGDTITEAFNDLIKNTKPYELNNIVSDIENSVEQTEVEDLKTHAATSDFCSAEWKNAFDKANAVLLKIRQSVSDRLESILEDKDYPFFNIIQDIIEEYYENL